MNLESAFNTFSASAFRLEGMPQYQVEQEVEALSLFERTGRLPDAFNEDWVKLVRNIKSSGKRIERLRLFSDEPTSYERFELAAYERSRAAGEDIRFALRSDHPRFRDFWLFDEHVIAVMSYSGAGSFLGADTHEASPRELTEAFTWRTLYASASTVPPSC